MLNSSVFEMAKSRATKGLVAIPKRRGYSPESERQTRWRDDPRVKFAQRELVGTGASVTIFVVARIGEWVIEHSESVLPLANNGASETLRIVFTWGAAVFTTASWVMMTWFELRHLLRRVGRED